MHSYALAETQVLTFANKMMTFVALMEAELQQLPCRVIFGGFRALTGTWALMNRRKLQNPPKIALYGNCRSSASRRATKVPKVPFGR